MLLICSSSLWAASTGTASLDGGEAMGIDEAIAAWKTNGGFLKLESDCEYESTSALSLTKTQTLDLSGFSLTFKTKAADAITLANGASLTIVDGSEGDAGSLSSVSTSTSQTDIIWAKSGSTLIIEEGTFSVSNTNGKTVYALYLNSGTTGSISIAGGVFENDNKTFTSNIGIISGGKFAVQPAYYTPVEGKIFEKVDGYYQLADGTYFVSVDNVGYSTIEDFNNALSSDPTKYSTVAVFENKDITIPEGKYAILTQTTSGQENGTFTNNGDVKLSSSQTWTSGAIINNATMAISSGTWKGTEITNNSALTISAATWNDAQILNDGEMSISGGTWNDAALTNNGTATISGGRFKTELYDNLTAAGAALADGCAAYTYYSDATYKQVLAEANVVATVSDGENVKAFTSISTAISYSSKEHPAVVAKDCTFSASVSSTGADRYLNLNGYTLTQTSSAYVRKGALTIEGEGTINYTGSDVAFWVIGSNNATAENYSVLNIGEKVTYNALNGYGICSDQYSSSKSSYGVVVNIAGTVNSRYFAIYVNGNVQALTGNVPVYNVAKTAKLTSVPSIAMYAAGYAIWNIEGELSGDTPIYVKAGTVNLNGAKVTATGAKVAPVPNGNGANNTGDAIILDSKKGYAGTIVLNVTGETELVSENGYALHEALTDLNKTATIGLAIESGAFEGGAGAVEISPAFAAAMEDGSQGEQWTLNAVVGGKYSSMPEVVADGYEVVVTADAQFPYSVQRMTEPIIPQESTEYITENTTSATVRTVGTTETDKFAVIVKSGVTYEVEGLVVGNNAETEAKVVVEPGATLIVGASGIITHKAGNLILKADREHGTAKLIFKDANSINTNPLATVELYLRARTLNAETKAQLWQHYGLPVSYDEGLTSVEKNFGVNYNNWIVGRGWKYVAGTDMLSEGAWAGHNITTNASVEGSIIRFKGQLVGRDNKELDFVPGYSCFTNSYSAPLSLRSLRSKLNASGVAEPVIWIYDVSYAPTFRLVNNSFKDNDFLDKGIASMQAFFIPSESSAHSLTIDYQNDVIGFSNGSVKEAEVSEYNGGTIVLSDGFNNAELIITEGDEFSDAYDRGWDANLMPGITPAIFVAEGTAKYASLATNAIEGKKISIITNNATEYTLSFKFLEGKAFKLKDLASGAEIEVSAESTYRFTAEANSTIERFELLEGTVAANEADANSVNVWVANNNLNIAGAAEGDAIEAINLAGVKIISAAATGEAVQAISLSGIASGAYIVKVGAATVKVIK